MDINQTWVTKVTSENQPDLPTIGSGESINPDAFIARYVGESINPDAFLARYGLVVYQHPAPHIPLEDIKLALTSEQYQTLLRQTLIFIGDDAGRTLGVVPNSLILFLKTLRD